MSNNFEIEFLENGGVVSPQGFEAGSARGDWVKGYLNPRGLRILAALDAVAARHAAQPAEVALAWLMARPGVTAPIASATRLDQLEGLIRATELRLAADDIAALDQASTADEG